MKIRKYVAGSMKEALMQIKSDLGNDAIILKTSKVPRKMFSFSGREGIEVTAAIDSDAPPRHSAMQATIIPTAAYKAGIYKRPKPIRPVASDNGITKESPIPTLEHNAEGVKCVSNKLDPIESKEDIRQTRELLKPILTKPGPIDRNGFTGPWGALYDRLLTSDVNAAVARGIITRIFGEGDVSLPEVDKRFSDELRNLLPVSGPLKLKPKGPLLCAFVGPTGVGKTTTLAKLAAHYRLNKNKSISILTIDTYRIAAIEQIRTFADIMDIKVHEIFSPDEIPEALCSCQNDDIVFIDTAGRSRHNIDHMRDLQAFLEKIRPDETHLVLSATTKDSDLSDAINRFRPLGANRVLFTKFDETSTLGNVFNAMIKAKGFPASYFTFGQSVPDDIELAQPVRFVRRLWKANAL